MNRFFPILCAAFILAGKSSFAAVPAGTMDERLQQLLKQFPDADLNKDGKLTPDEFRQFKGKAKPGGTPTPARPSSSSSSSPPSETPDSANQPVSAGKLEITISSAKPVPINPKIYGINCSEMFIFDLVQKPEYLEALGELQFNTFLFPGGSSYHHPTGSGGFNIREEEIAKSRHGTEHRINKVGSPDFFKQYVGFMKPMGGHAVFIPNIPNGTIEELDWYLKTMKEARVPVETVVLGMEVQLGAFRFESSAAYIAAIKPFVAFLKAEHPDVRIVGWSTPVGRKASVPKSYKEWNREVSKLPGIDGFAQYGWTEFASAARRGRGVGAAGSSPEERLQEYDAFVESFPEKEIKTYTEDWGVDKKMFLLQWGTHADRNTVVEGLHSVNFLFFMTQYNATHDNYFEVANWSVPIMQDLTSGKRKGNGGGVTYKKDIALWTSYLYVKPLRHFYAGDKSLLTTSVAGVDKNGAMEVVKTLAGTGPDGKKLLCILNRGPALALSGIAIDGKSLPSGDSIHVESVSGPNLSATGGSLKTFVGDKTLGSVSIEPFSITTLIFP